MIFPSIDPPPWTDLRGRKSSYYILIYEFFLIYKIFLYLWNLFVSSSISTFLSLCEMLHASALSLYWNSKKNTIELSTTLKQLCQSKINIRKVTGQAQGYYNTGSSRILRAQRVTTGWPRSYRKSGNHATFPLRIRKITVQICGNFWVTQ